MNRILTWTAGAALLLAAGCGREAAAPADGLLTVRLEASGDETRTELGAGVSYGKLVWNADDIIALHMSDGAYTEETVAPDANPETGKVVSSTITGLARDFYAVYPASATVASYYGNTELRVQLPTTYSIASIVDGTGSHTADWAPVPMVADNAASSSILKFYQVGGLLRIKLTGVNASTQKIRVTFDKDVTGTFAVANLASLSTSSPNPTITTAAADGGKVVTYTVASSTVGSTSVPIVLNIPVPCQTFASVKVESLNASGGVLATKTYTEHPVIISRHHGKKLNLGTL